eukprot:4583002-Pleurochrysis_carterae.AAC.2
MSTAGLIFTVDGYAESRGVVLAIHACERKAAASREQLCAKCMIYRAVQCVGARGCVHRLLRKCAGERPAVVDDRGVAAYRLPPGR